jgi:hypothetical protein
MTATTEPSEVRVGDSWAWRREDLTADYPASEWTLVYAFRNASVGFEITAAADDDYFEVSVAGSLTEEYEAGAYAWGARVVNIADATIRHTVDGGTITVLPNMFIDEDALDARTFARQMLDQVEAALLAVMTQKASGTGIKAYSIAGRSMEYADADTEVARLEKSRDRWRLAVAREDQAEGRPNNISRFHGVRFTRV